MRYVTVTRERIVDAPPAVAFAFLRDYQKRSRILPPNISGYQVESGGEGSGTVVRYRLRAGRRERAYHLEVEETTAGRELRERDKGSTFVTTWTVEPAEGGKKTSVRLHSQWRGAGGVGGIFERIFAPRGLGRIYDDLLSRLDAALGADGPA
jgi:carbon monoxide dehydrogenase subunit G